MTRWIRSAASEENTERSRRNIAAWGSMGSPSSPDPYSPSSRWYRWESNWRRRARSVRFPEAASDCAAVSVIVDASPLTCSMPLATRSMSAF